MVSEPSKGKRKDTERPRKNVGNEAQGEGEAHRTASAGALWSARVGERPDL